MKKLFSIGVLTLVMLTSCQNSNDEITSKPEAKTQVSKAMASKTTGSGPSDDALINSVSDFMEANRLPGGGAIINCHTSYSGDTGHACVSSGGYTFNVSWTIYEVYPNGQVQVLIDPIYTATAVSSCGC